MLSLHHAQLTSSALAELNCVPGFEPGPFLSNRNKGFAVRFFYAPAVNLTQVLVLQGPRNKHYTTRAHSLHKWALNFLPLTASTSAKMKATQSSTCGVFL